MSSRRTLILIAAVVIGAISAFLVFNYVNSADDRARENARTVTVLKIAKNVPKGTFGQDANSDGSIVTAEIAAEFKPVTAIVDPSIIANKVAVSDFVTGQILVDGMFADPIDNRISMASRVSNECAPTSAVTGAPTPCVAITISVDQTKGVAGLIQPGDFVNVLLMPDTGYCKKPDDQGFVEIEGTKGSVISKLPAGPQPPLLPDDGVAICNPARYLYQQVKVLFVDKSAIPQPGEVTATGGNAATSTGTAQTAVNTGLITLEVPPKAAQLIASVAPEMIYLTLLPNDYQPEALPKLDPYPPVLPGEDSTQLTPYGPSGIQNQ